MDLPPALSAALEAMPEAARESFWQHLVGGTSAEWLAGECKRAGLKLGATTIKKYRRALSAEDVQS